MKLRHFAALEFLLHVLPVLDAQQVEILFAETASRMVALELHAVLELFRQEDHPILEKPFRHRFLAGLTIGIGADLHVGYQRYQDTEDLFRSSNGWGSISIPGGTATCPATACGTAKPAFFLATLQQQTAGNIPTIHSELHSQNIEINDTIHRTNWTYNIGLLASNDTYYGQGLAKADNIAGYVKSPGTKYLMHNVPFSQMMQPRLGATPAKL